MALSPLRSSRPQTWREAVLTETTSLPDTSSPLGLRPSQQPLRKLGGSMQHLPPGDAPETSRIDLGGTKGTRVNRRASFAPTGNAEEAVARAVGAFWKL
jgi:hypothetical protein